jgi:HlyD family secretion protein
MSKKFLSAISKRKLIIIIAILLISGGVYFRFLRTNEGETRYVLAIAEKGTIIVSVSGNGQVSASDQVEIKSKVRGDVAAVYIEKGEEINAGKLIVKLSDTEYRRAVTDAEIAVETAENDLKELLSPADEAALLKAENTVLQAKNSLEKLIFNQETEYQKALETIQKAEEDIERAYEDVLNTVTNVFWDLPTIITGIRNILYSSEIGQSEITVNNYQSNTGVYKNLVLGEQRAEVDLFIRSAEDSYKTARESYDQNFENYKKASYYSEKEILENLLDETIEAVKLTAQAIKDEANLVSFIIDYLSSRDRSIYKKITDYQADLKNYTSKTSSHLSSLLSIQRSLASNKEAKANAEQALIEMEKVYPLDLTASEINLEEKEKNLTDLKAAPAELEIRIKERAVQQKQDALLVAKQELADCYIYAPFDGIVTDVKIKKGDSIGTGAVLANIITQQKIAELSLNEIDAAKVKVGQKATLVFDAVPEAKFTGRVVDVDLVGTVTQGVVSYGVKIAFDTEDERIKPGMSVTADIVAESKQNVILVPNSAVKFQEGSYYIELVTVPEETRQELLASVSAVIQTGWQTKQGVKTGLSNELFTEITSGLEQGDIVISSVLSSGAQVVQTGTIQTQGIQVPGMGGQKMRLR